MKIMNTVETTLVATATTQPMQEGVANEVDNRIAAIDIRLLTNDKIATKPLIAKILERAGIVAKWDLLHSAIVFENAPTNWYNVDPLHQASTDLSAVLRNANHRYAGAGEIAEMLTSIAYDNAFHPVRDFLVECERDYRPSDRDYIKEYQDLLTIENDTPQLRALLKKFILAMGLLPFNNSEKGNILTQKPDTGSHIVPLLIGKQGIGKGSYLRRIVVNPMWYTDNVQLDFSRPSSLKLATEYWLTELSEIEDTTKKENNQLKPFITTARDTVHILYAKSDPGRARTTSFIGTSNQETPLRDVTGNRRFLIVKLKAVAIAKLFDTKANGYITDEFMCNFWGQVMYELRACNFDIHPTPTETAWLLKQAQTATLTCEGEEELIASYDWSITDKTKWAWRTAKEITDDIKARYPFAGFAIKPTTITRILIPKLQSADFEVESRVDRHSRLMNYLTPPRYKPPERPPA